MRPADQKKKEVEKKYARQKKLIRYTEKIPVELENCHYYKNLQQNRNYWYTMHCSRFMKGHLSASLSTRKYCRRIWFMIYENFGFVVKWFSVRMNTKRCTICIISAMYIYYYHCRKQSCDAALAKKSCFAQPAHAVIKVKKALKTNSAEMKGDTESLSALRLDEVICLIKNDSFETVNQSKADPGRRVMGWPLHDAIRDLL